MMNKNILSLIALHLDDKSLLRLCRANKKINDMINDDFWRSKLLRLGMKDVSKENIEDPREAYKQLVSIGGYHNSKEIMHKAIKLGMIYPIKYLLDGGCQLKGLALGQSSYYGHLELALGQSSYYGHLELVKYLVKQKADIHYHNDYPLRIATEYGHYEVVKYLVEQGADMHQSGNGYNAISLAKNTQLHRNNRIF